VLAILLPRKAQNLRSLEGGESHLKRLRADLSLDGEMWKAGPVRKRNELVDCRTDANWLRVQWERAGERLVCLWMSITVNSFRDKSCRSAGQLREPPVFFAKEKPRWLSSVAGVAGS